MDHASDIIIVGGGLNGPTLALPLARAGLRVTLVDAQDTAPRIAEDFDGRSYALALASQRLLATLGIWDMVADQSQPMLEIKVTDGRAGEGPGLFGLHFDHAEIEEGPMGYMLEDRCLRRALMQQVADESGITVMDGETVTDQQIARDGVAVTLQSGQVLTARLLIGADGRRSGVAERAGLKRTVFDYGQTALVCAVSHERPHNGVAHQFFMPPGPLAILPLPENRSSIVWSERTDRAERIQALSDDAYLAELRPRFGDFLGEIGLAGARYTYPLNLTQAQSLIADRVALIGDAAQGLHPIAGQGLNAGLRDVGALAEVLIDASRRGEDIASPLVLQRYQEWRRFDRASLALATDVFNRLFSNDNSLLRAVRGLGMGVVNALPGARRGFIREAAGLTGDLPRLLQGRPI